MSEKSFDDVHDSDLHENGHEFPEADIVRALKPFHRDHERLKEELMASLPGMSSATQSVQDHVLTHTKRRAWVMRTSGGLVAVVAVMVMVWLSMTGSNENVAYGIEGLQERLLKVRSVHMKGWTYHWMFDKQNNRVGDKPMKLPMEQYYERPNRYFFTMHGIMPNKVTRGFSASDGKRQIQIIHDDKLAIAGKANSLAAELIVEYRLQSEIFGGFLRKPEVKYKKVGNEKVKGVRVVVYQYDYKADGIREKMWINPKTGFPVRMETYRKDNKTGVEELYSVYDQIEINVPIMPEQFPLHSPKGYRLLESDFSKGVFSFGSGSDDQTTLETRFGINIDNKAVLTCWRHDWVDPKGKPVPPKEPIFTLDFSGKSEPCEHSLLRVDTIEGHHWHWALLMPKDPKYVINYEVLNSIVQKSNGNRLSLQDRPLRFSEERLKKIIFRFQKTTLAEGAETEQPITLERLRKAIAEVRGEKLF